MASSRLVRRLAAVWRADANPDRLLPVDRPHAAVPGRGDPHWYPLHPPTFADLLLRHAETRHAALHSVFDPAVGGVHLADGRDGSPRGARGAGGITPLALLAITPRSVFHCQMELAAKPAVDGEHRPVDVTDKTVS